MKILSNLNTQKMKNYQVELKWGLFFVVASLVWMLIEKGMGLHGERIADHPIYTNLFAIIAIAVYVFALREKRQSLGGFMTWKQGFLSGVVITGIVVLFSPLTQWITHNVISPEYFTNAINYSVESGNATQAEAEAFFTLQSYMMQASIGALIMGLLTAAIVAFFVRKNVSIA